MLARFKPKAIAWFLIKQPVQISYRLLGVAESGNESVKTTDSALPPKSPNSGGLLDFPVPPRIGGLGGQIIPTISNADFSGRCLGAVGKLPAAPLKNNNTV